MKKWEWSGLDIAAATTLVSSRKYDPAMFGALIVDDYGTKGVAGFCWFPTEQELADFLAQIEPRIYEDELDEDQEASIANAMDDVPPLTEAARAKS